MRGGRTIPAAVIITLCGGGVENTGWKFASAVKQEFSTGRTSVVLPHGKDCDGEDNGDDSGGGFGHSCVFDKYGLKDNAKNLDVRVIGRGGAVMRKKQQAQQLLPSKGWFDQHNSIFGRRRRRLDYDSFSEVEDAPISDKSNPLLSLMSDGNRRYALLRKILQVYSLTCIYRGIKRIKNPSDYYSLSRYSSFHKNLYSDGLSLSANGFHENLSKFVGLSLNFRAILIRVLLKKDSVVEALGISFIPRILFLLRSVSIPPTEDLFASSNLVFPLYFISTCLIACSMIIAKSRIAFLLGCCWLSIESIASSCIPGIVTQCIIRQSDTLFVSDPIMIGLVREYGMILSITLAIMGIIILEKNNKTIHSYQMKTM